MEGKTLLVKFDPYYLFIFVTLAQLLPAGRMPSALQTVGGISEKEATVSIVQLV